MCVRDRKMSGCASDQVGEAVGLRAHVRDSGRADERKELERWLERRLRKRIYRCMKEQGLLRFWCEIGAMRHPRRETFEKFRQRELF